MDKYTVDLDQVLNDFEYSELTDQQSKNASERPQNTTSFQPHPVTKHSITNVFHSLNEYLNSEINSGSNNVALRGEGLGDDNENLGKKEGTHDNNLSGNIKESHSHINEASNNVKLEVDVTKNSLESFNHSFENLGQNERLLKLKNEPQIEDILEKDDDILPQVKDSELFQKMQQGQLQEDIENLNLLSEDTKNIQENSQLNLLELENPISHKKQSLDDFQQDVNLENDPSGKNNENFNKTEKENISLLDMENFESELIPELNCTENNINSKFQNVNNDKECDKNVDNKADNNSINDLTNFAESENFFTVNNECRNEDNIINISESNKNKDSLLKKIDNIHAKEEEGKGNPNILKSVENFVIELSESPYALGQDSLPCDNSSTSGEIIDDTPLVVEDGENVIKLQSTIEPLAENETPSHKSEPCDNESNSTNNTKLNCLKEELSTNNDSNIKQDTILTETITHIVEDNSGSIKGHSEDTEQKIVVGFSSDVDIDENELNKLLEELELEESSNLAENIVEKDNLKKTEETLLNNQETKIEQMNKEYTGVNNLVRDGNLDEHVEDATESHIDDNGKTEPISCKAEAKSDFHKEISLENQKDIEDGQIMSKSMKMIDNTKLIECLEIEKPSKSKKSSSKSNEKSEKIKKELTGTTEISQEQPSVTKGETESVETGYKQPVDEPRQQEIVHAANVDQKPTLLQTQPSQDSLTRPQDLPLNNQLKEETVPRKIDLIGSPGSTPYNNVYVNKSMEPKTTQDTDSDYTSSASPTFSDCSTESTSTASTASVEDFPKNSDGVTNVSSKTRGHKTRHSDKTSVKNKDSGQGEQGEGDKGTNLGENIVQDTEGAVGHSNKNPTNTNHNSSDISKPAGGDSQESSSQPTETFIDNAWLGKEAPLWIPDSDAASCLHCEMKFTVLKRRHHCRACGLVLCSKCCNLKFRLEYLDAEARVCTKCFHILSKDSNNPSESGHNTSDSGDSPAFRPNPNNPLEYCSTVSPLQQMEAAGATPPSVMVPVGVLKRKGSNKKSNKSVMFCDGIAPGSDLTHLDQDFNYHPETKIQKSPQKVPEVVKKTEEPPPVVPTVKTSRNLPKVDEDSGSFIPKSETSLPPTVCVNKTDIFYSECLNSPSVVEMLKNEALTFAINPNLFVQVRVINMSCCINKHAWCFSTEGMINVGSDEFIYLIEYIDEESFLPKDMFFHINNVYLDAVKGTSIKELGLSLHNTSNFLDSKNHAGFVYLRPTFQCLENVVKLKDSYLIGILIHRWETPWAKLFPLRLLLRLGAEYRYYPSPLISTRHRDSVFVEIGHTIINLLADFRNFTYTLPQIRGLIIHMEDKKTTITIPKNRYDQVMKSINNSSDHILAFAGNFSSEADSHLVCIQDTQGHENCYTTHAINIHNKPRKVTGASFIVFNGSLKSSSGLTAKSNIVEDGLMIQIPSEHMEKIRDNLRHMKDHTIACGCINATSDETVNIVWGESDVDFNVGVQSPVDLADMKGVPSIRVHNGKDFVCNNGTRLIRWTEVFILQNGEENPKNQDPVDISKVSESIAKACCTALMKYLDLLVSNSCQKIGIRTTLHVENVAYSAGSNGLKLPPIYMRSLDNELIPVLHKITSNNLGDNAIVLELIFRILNA